MNRVRLFFSLRFRLMVLVLLAIIPVLGITLHDAAELRQREVAQAQADALILSQLVARQHEEVVEATRRTLLSLAQLPEVRSDDPAACRARLIALLSEYEDYSAFAVADSDGNLFCNTISTESANGRDRAWFWRTMQNRDFSVGDYQVGRLNNARVVVFGYPIFDPTGQLQGVMAASLNVDQLNQIAAEVELPAGTTLTIIDRQGAIVIRQPDPDIWVGQTLPNEPLVMAIREVGQGKTEVADLDGVTRLFAFTPIHGSVNTGLYVAIGIPRQVAFAEADRIWQRNLLNLGLVGLLALVAAWLGSDLFVLRPTNRLIAATERLRRDLSARTGLTYAGELGQLAWAFDSLATELEQRQHERAQARQELLALNASLEERVAKRTAELEASEQTFRELVNNLPIAVYVCDAAGLIENYNQSAKELWRREPRLSNATDRFCGSYRMYTGNGTYLPHADCPMAQVLQTGTPISNAEVVIERPDGSRRLAIVNIIPRRNEQGDITGAINCVIDVTDLKQAEEALEKSRMKFQGLFESAPDAIILTNNQGQIVELNREAEELFDYDRNDLLQQPIEILLPARFQPRHLQHRAAYYADPHSRQMGFGLELYGRRRDGTEVPVDITLSPLRMEDDILTISIIRDITEHKRLEAELTTMQHQLLESSETERLRIAQELHDGPIQELYGVAYRLSEIEQGLSDEAGIGHLVASAALVQQVTQNLRTICMALRPPTLADFGLEKAIRSHAVYFQAAHPGLKIEFDLAADGQRLPERVRLALFRIYQAALNNIARHAQARHIRVRLQLEEKQVVLEIQDDGRGFQMPRRWVSLAREGHLGLVGMRERIQAVNGKLEIVTAPGEGTIIRATAPYLKQPMPALEG